MNKRLSETIESILDKEKRKQAIVFEFTPDTSKTKEAHVSMLDHIEEQVKALEKAIGHESRLVPYKFELHGYNLMTALHQAYFWLNPYVYEGKISDRVFEESNTKLKNINDHLKKKIENNPISLQQLKNLKDLFDLFKGLLKYENLINKSLALSRTHEKLSSLREIKEIDLERLDHKITAIETSTVNLKGKISSVSSKIREQLSSVNEKVVELENSVKTIL